MQIWKCLCPIPQCSIVYASTVYGSAFSVPARTNTPSNPLNMQVMYNFLCRKAIWDVGGVWSWLVVAQKETINAVASYDVKGNLVSAFVITRQGLLHNYLSLVAGSSSQMQMQAPVNSFGDDLATPKKILEVSKAVMGKTFNPNDSLCKPL